MTICCDEDITKPIRESDQVVGAYYFGREVNVE
jgi:hypothetical protein